MNQLVGRVEEKRMLFNCLNSSKSEFVVVYGRRRIGKTFLIRSFFEDKYDFCYVGKHNYAYHDQLKAFAAALKQYSGSKFDIVLNNWDDAFKNLATLLDSITHDGKKIIFIDEMPWIDGRRSDFVPALENFWNSYATFRDDLMLVACGSSTSWIVDKVLKNQGGLFNRVTMQIYLRPFNLGETREYLRLINCNWDNYQIAQCYMVLGGVPFYYSLLNSGMSLVQNIDFLFFSSKNAVLKTEFSQLFESLFNNYEKYIEIIKILLQRFEGFTRTEITEMAGFGGSHLSKILRDLERCDFIISSNRTGGGVKNQIFRICDFYTLFYFKFLENNPSASPNYWQKMSTTSKIAAWQGFSFELLCLLHRYQIEKALGINGILTTISTWRSKDNTAQIDLVIERSDRVVNLCEMKFSTKQYTITNDYDLKLRQRMSVFAEETKTKYALNYVFVTTFGVSNPQNHSIVSNNITLDDLF